MSVNNFKPTLWEGALLSLFHSNSIAQAMMTKPTNKNGEKVVFTFVQEGTISDYDGTVDWKDINTVNKELLFDKQKYFAIKLDDVDAVQTRADVLRPTVEEHTSLLLEQFDRDFFKTLTDGAVVKIGSTSNKIKVNASNVYDKIVDMATELRKRKVPKSDCFVTVSAEILGLLAKDRRFTGNPVVLANGFVEGQKVSGLQVMTSEELPANKMVAHHVSAAGGDKQIDKVEAMRLESSFSDGVRGLMKYGFTRLRDNAVVVLHYDLGAEPDPIGVVVKNDDDNPVITKEKA